MITRLRSLRPCFHFQLGPWNNRVINRFFGSANGTVTEPFLGHGYRRRATFQ